MESEPIAELLANPEMEIRAQAARVLGWIKSPQPAGALIERLKDPSPRVRFLAAIALGEIGAPEAFEPLLDLIAENDNRDRYLRHGAVMGLVGCASEEALEGLTGHAAPAVRLAAVLALRKTEGAGVAAFLKDSDFYIAAEAARAINDVPIPEGMTELAAALDRLPTKDSLAYEPLVRRILNAHYRLGGAENAERLAEFADSQADPARRAEALMRLGEWGDPDNQDKVVGVWRPLPDRDSNVARSAIEKRLDSLVADPDPGVRKETIRLVAGYGFKGYDGSLLATLKDIAMEVPTRIEAVKSLVALNSDLAFEAIEFARASEDPKLRSGAIAQLGKLDPKKAMSLFAQVLETGEMEERQSALSSLAEIEDAEADRLLLVWLGKLQDGTAPKEIHLDILTAAYKRSAREIEAIVDAIEDTASLDYPLRHYRPCLFGGDAERGKKIFFENASTSCTRCHILGGIGGVEVGPNLSDVGVRLDRETILEAIVSPNSRIAEGFENVTLSLADGSWLLGRVLEENETTLKLELAAEDSVSESEEVWWEEEGSDTEEVAQEAAFPHSVVDIVAEGEAPPVLETRVVEKIQIKERKRNLSAMPENLPLLLNPMEIRDLVEFLAELK